MMGSDWAHDTNSMGYINAVGVDRLTNPRDIEYATDQLPKSSFISPISRQSCDVPRTRYLFI